MYSFFTVPDTLQAEVKRARKHIWTSESESTQVILQEVLGDIKTELFLLIGKHAPPQMVIVISYKKAVRCTLTVSFYFAIQ